MPPPAAGSASPRATFGVSAAQVADLADGSTSCAAYLDGAASAAACERVVTSGADAFSSVPTAVPVVAAVA